MEMSSEFYDLFVWKDGAVEDVRFWCEPELTHRALDLMAERFDFSRFDGFGGLEAKGFYLAGVASHKFKLPTLLIRKHKPFFDVMSRVTFNFRNWKGEEESLTVLKNTMPDVKRILIVDDVLDSGASLKASVELLKKCNIEIGGAFYILNSAGRDLVESFDFPIECVLERKLFT